MDSTPPPPPPSPPVEPPQPPSPPNASWPPDIARSASPGGRRKGLTGVAWILIAVFVIGMMVLRQLGAAMIEDEPNPDDSIGLTIAEITAKYVMGSKYFMTSGDVSADTVYWQTKPTLRTGSVNQRIAFVIFTAEMIDAEAAAEELADLEYDLEEARQEWEERKDEDESADAAADADAPAFELRDDQQVLLDAVDTLYRTGNGEPAESPRLDALNDEHRATLRESLGWFGRLALHPPDQDSPERRDLESSARALVLALLLIFVAGGLGALCGLALLILFAVLAFTRRIRSGVERVHASLDPAGALHHGVYAETFAIWLGLFVVLLFVAELAASAVPAAGLLVTAVVFFLSLSVLLWPVARGIDWQTVRREIGWSAPRGAGIEVVMGPVGYIGGLPLLGVGVLGVLVLTFIQNMFVGPGPTFGGSGGPAHPIVAEIADGGFLAMLQIYLVASVAAPIVEETMFRGVLYRHLRDATRGWGLSVSVLFSTLLNSFIFAIIHPQGWVAVPALMALAIAFSLAREWRGSLLPAILMHAISNGIVMTILMICLKL